MKFFYVYAIMAVCLIFQAFAIDYYPLEIFNTSGPTVANVVWADAWSPKSDYPGAFIFTSAANSLLHRDRLIPDSAIYVIPEVASKLFSNASELSYELVSVELPWANELKFIAPGTIGLNVSFPALLGVSGRFPSAPRFRFPSSAGKVFILNTSILPALVYIISPPETCEWYYQTFKLIDMNGDGLLDVLSIRLRDDVCFPLKVAPPYALKAELVVLTQPTNPLSVPWSLTTLYNFDNVTNRAAGGYFEFLDIDEPVYRRNDHPTAELLTSEFFGAGAFIYSVSLNETWLTPNKTVKRTIIENGLGGMYTIRVIDVNSDDKSDFVITTHTVLSSNGIYAYDIKGDYRNQTNLTSVRYQLAGNFTVFGRSVGPSRYRTGPFEIVSQKPGRKPTLVVGTDGGGQLILLSPKNENSRSWEYNNETLAQFGCDFIAPIVYDADGDGKNEISAPCFGRDAIYSFTTIID